jgi:outer membrane protein assembly factor BamA
VVQRHRYALTALYGPEHDRLMYLADYAYDGLRPTLRLFASDFDRTYDDLLQGSGDAADYTERERTFGGEIGFDFPGFEASHAIAFGYRYRDLSGITPLPPGDGYDGELPATGPLGSLRLSWAFSNARRQDLSISPEDGRRVALGLERYQEGVGSGYSFTRAVLDWSEYLPLPAPRHVLAARLFLGRAGGDVPTQSAFQLGGETPGETGYALDDHSLPLRGYPPNAFRGERAVLAGLEYRFPLLEVGRGGVSAPFFLRRLHGALFVEAGEAWDDGAFSAGEMHAGIGAELRLDLFFSYFLPMTVRLGIAAGLDEGGGVYPTLGIWMPQGLLESPTATHRR